MADDGSFKGHGGKPGRKSTVISMSAHKNRHSADSEQNSKKLTGLTLFDFSPEGEDAPAGESKPAVKVSPASAAKTATVAAAKTAATVAAAKTAAAAAAAAEAKSTHAALPCENTPFERDSGLGGETRPSPARRFMRWGLEDGGQSEPLSVRDIFEEASAEDLDDDDQFLQALIKERNRERWHHKASRSGSLVESFYHAIHGLKVGFTTQRNIRIHCCIASGVFILALLLRVDPTSWLALGLATGFVLFAEYINTAVEHVTDIQANFRYHRSARYAKDTAAAAVLVAALTAVLVGAIVFTPRIFALISAQF